MSSGRQRFSIIPAAAVTDRRLEPRDLQVLCLLGRHTDNHGWCCRSQVKMARELACGRATVQRSLTRLVDAGYLEHRAIYRDSGADAAHEYRVLLDTRDGAEIPQHATGEIPQFDGGEIPHLDGGEISHRKGGAHTWAGVPIHGQGCPPIDGHGVPTHEWAPMLTTPVKREERGRARDDEEFEAARKAWPTGFADSREDALTAWRALAEEDRREALAEIGRYVSTTKAIGRKFFGTFASYLTDRKWQALPERPKTVSRPAEEREPAAPVRSKPTSFQRANPHLYPELFGDAGGAAEARP
jgi:hypothetical protein